MTQSPPADGRPATVSAALGLGSVLAVTLGALLAVGPTAKGLLEETRGVSTFRDSEVVSGPVPETAVDAAQAILPQDASWSLTTATGTCQADPAASNWLAYRLYPRPLECADPDYELYYGVPLVTDGVVYSGDGFVIRERSAP